MGTQPTACATSHYRGLSKKARRSAARSSGDPGRRSGWQYYRDDDPGKLWHVILYVDERGTASQQEVLETFFSGVLEEHLLEITPAVSPKFIPCAVLASSSAM